MHRWIISRRVDLSLIIGSGLAGYLYLFLFVAAGVPIGYLWWFWSVGFDGTHIFGTASRTYLDPQTRSRRPWLLYGSAAFFFSLGPAMVLLGAKGYLALLVGIWAYYHVVRQHYGFMVLYKVKNHDLALADNRLDRLFLGVMMLFPPIHRFFIHHPEELGLKQAFLSAEPWAWAIVGVTAAAWGIRQFAAPKNVPKYLLLAAIVPLHWATFAFMSWQAAVPTVTIVHNLQYHALIWFHNRNRYGAADAARHSLLAYAILALVFSAAYRVPGFQLGRVSDLAFGFFCGFGLTHYYLDSRIWRVRHDPELRYALKLA